MPVAVVTDSTAYLPERLLAERDIRVVPLRVLLGHATYDEDEVAPGVVAAAMRAHTRITTSRPAPDAFAAAYAQAARDGYDSVVSVHLSAEMSGTCAGARAAAAVADLPVEVVDTRSLGLGVGFAALAAADVRDAGGTAQEAARTAQTQAVNTAAYVAVATLEPLRQGGRIGAAGALVGSALSIKPVLALDDGRIVPVETVRTTGRALERLAEISMAFATRAGDRPVRLGVHHLADPDRARDLAERLGRDVPHAEPVLTREVGAVVGAHVGPGMLAVIVAPFATITLGNRDKA